MARYELVYFDGIQTRLPTTSRDRNATGQTLGIQQFLPDPVIGPEIQSHIRRIALVFTGGMLLSVGSVHVVRQGKLGH